MNINYKQRNKEIYEDRLSGTFLSVIGDKHGISGERVRQIVIKQARIESGAPHPYEAPGLRVIGNIPLSTRSGNCFANAGIMTAHQLIQHTAEELLSIRNFGPKSLREVRSVLDEYGVHLKGDPSPTTFKRRDPIFGG